MYFEDLKVGEMFEVPISRTITETDIVNYLCLSGTFESILLDVEYASKSTFGKRVAPGMLTLGIALGLSSLLRLADKTAVALLGLEHVKFSSAVIAGDTITTAVTITDKRQTKNPAHGVVTYKHVTRNQRGEVVLEFERLQLIRSKTQSVS